MSFTRRDFMKTTGAGIMVCGLPCIQQAGFIEKSESPNKKSFQFAIAGYSFLKFNLDQSLSMMQRLGIYHLALKDFHLPLNSSQEEIDRTLAKMNSSGVSPYGVGPIYMKTEVEADQAFSYAKKAGVSLVIGVPNYELLPYVEKKIKAYDIRLAIHNHGPDIQLYPSVDDIWNNIKSRDQRMGICMDIGHTTRLGLDPVTTFLKYKDRIFDIHIWDCDKPKKKGWCVEGGRGIIDFPRFFKALKKADYRGTCSLEYAKDMTDPLPGMAESFGYFNGVLAGLNV